MTTKQNKLLASLGPWLKSMRADRKLTQELAAKKIGISRVHLCNVELGKAEPSVVMLQRMARAYGRELRIGFLEKE